MSPRFIDDGSSTLGWMISPLSQHLPIPSRIFDAFMQNMAGNIESEQYSSLGTFWFILTNNFRVCLIALVTAPLLFFEPLIPLVNGAVITAMGAMVVDVTGSMGLFLAATLPHGILELAAILTCSAAALSLGITFDVNIFTNGLKAAWPEMKFQLKVFLAALLAIPLAALIEMPMSSLRGPLWGTVSLTEAFLF